jgi:hypothetical protein
VSAPLDFLKIFAGQLRQAGISFAITSGMACVHYGLQQTTKDSDWIIPAEGLEKLRKLFTELEGQMPPWRIAYRQICGAPLEAEFMEHGWTSHLSILDTPGLVEHKVDIFSKPPRVRLEELQTDTEGWASEHNVAQMKKTDRDRDWPMVDGLGRLLRRSGSGTAVLHLTHLPLLMEAWQRLDDATRQEMAGRRPLLRALLSATPLAPPHFDLMLMVERLIWERVNHQRYSRYTRPWRDFYRAWRKELDWRWPTEEPFAYQHQRLLEAARRYGLPRDPLVQGSRENLIKTAVDEILAMQRFTAEDIAAVLPPVYELLP